MSRDFFIKVTFATHRVAEILPLGDLKERMLGSSNSLLAYLILTSESHMDPEEKRVLGIKALRELETLLTAFYEAKQKNFVPPENFLVLEKAYAKVRIILERMSQEQEHLRPSSVINPSLVSSEISIKPSESFQEELSSRQQKIMDLLKVKGKAQVWELQKLLQEVTKRTLRRDLDDLLKRNLIERAGEWNAIFYRIKPVENLLTEMGQR